MRILTKACSIIRASVLLLILLTSSVHCQEVENIQVQVKGHLIVVSFDLTSADPSIKYKIDLFSSHDDFQTPLTAVTGDVNEDIIPGSGKQIFWTPREELPGNFNQEIQFKIVSEAMVPPIDIEPFIITQPLAGSNFKRGKKLELRWTGSNPGNEVKFELFRDGQKVTDLNQIQNQGFYTWQIPIKTKVGKGYSIKLTDASDPRVSGFSEEFTLKHKLPTVVKLIPILAIGIVVTVMTTGGDEKQPAETDSLPEPIDPS